MVRPHTVRGKNGSSIRYSNFKDYSSCEKPAMYKNSGACEREISKLHKKETVLMKMNHTLKEKQGVLRYGRFGILHSLHRHAITGTINLFVLNNRLPPKEKKIFPVELDSLTLVCFWKVSKASLTANEVNVIY